MVVVVAGAGTGSVIWICSPRTGAAIPASAGPGEARSGTVVVVGVVVAGTGNVVVETAAVVVGIGNVVVDVGEVLGFGGDDGSLGGG